MNFVFNAIRFVANTALAFAIRTFHFGAICTGLLAVIWYLLCGIEWIEYVSGFAFAIAGAIVALSMAWEAYRLISTSKAFEDAKTFAHQSGHLWAYRKAADLSIPLCVALESIDFGVKQWNSDYSGILVDNTHREAAHLRKLANGTTNW
jgi:hypothetical protein